MHNSNSSTASLSCFTVTWADGFIIRVNIVLVDKMHRTGVLLGDDIMNVTDIRAEHVV